jgi:beta-lactamase class A
MRRREAIGLLITTVGAPRAAAQLLRRQFATEPDFGAIERAVAGRLGVAVLDVNSGRKFGHRADERFPMCSTFKWLLAAQLLARIDAGKENPARILSYTKADLLEYAPVTRARVSAGGMPIADLAAATIQVSDNTAGNLLLRSLGGPTAFTAFLRGIGDGISRLDRVEPDLNSAEPGDVRDTTTPNAMIKNMNLLLVGSVLSDASRKQLQDWLVGSTTGSDRLRAGISPGWLVGDKTGSGAYGSTNDIAIVWPPGRKPVLVAAYLTETRAAPVDRNAALAAVARETMAFLSGPG